MTYTSPFRLLETEHESEEPLCLSRRHHDDAEDATWAECFEAVVALANADVPQYAFGAARQFVELSLKRLAPGPAPRTHDLARLAALVPQLADTGEESQRIRAFALDLQAIDPGADGSRYAFTADGRAALGAVCCIEKAALIDLVMGVFNFTEQTLMNRAVPTGLDTS